MTSVRLWTPLNVGAFLAPLLKTFTAVSEKKSDHSDVSSRNESPSSMAIEGEGMNVDRQLFSRHSGIAYGDIVPHPALQRDWVLALKTCSAAAWDPKVNVLTD
ncbi:hypothetical protein TNCV_459011 [Trichonephila clavipes]|nr:hypothetical protein TNCV_459011 [Trichonephila clavipes]